MGDTPGVFISYSHDSPAHAKRVLSLSERLRKDGIETRLDQYVNGTPPEQWPRWMLDQLDWAAYVLLVCTETYYRRFRGHEEPGKGKGADWEGAIITQEIYDARSKTTKFVPVLFDPDDEPFIPEPVRGHTRYVLTLEQAYQALYDFLLDQAGFEPGPVGEAKRKPRRQAKPLTFGDAGSNPTSAPRIDLTKLPAGADESPRAASTLPPLSPHERVTIERLEVAEAQLFLSALQQGFPKRFPGAAVPASAAEMVRWFSSRDYAEVQPLFYLVRRALEAQKTQTSPKSQLRAGEEAAALLYCMAACRLVDTTVARENTLQNGGYVLFVPHRENIICAVIATALFGGSLHLKPPDPSDPLRLPRPEWVLDVTVSPNGDGLTQSFECAVFAAVFKNSRELSDLCLDSNGLTPQQRARLAARVGDIKDRELSLALVVHGVTQSEAVAGLANELQMPVLLPSTAMTTQLLGMDANRLVAEIGEFWRLVEESNDAVSTSNAPPSAIGTPTMSKSDIHFHAPVSNVAMSTGDHSAAQTGANSVANIGHKEGADLSALTPLLQELLAAIAELSSAKARDTLTRQVQTAQDAIADKDQPEPGRVKQALDAIKPAAEALEGGEKILSLCNRAYQLLAPLLGLPNLPLP